MGKNHNNKTNPAKKKPLQFKLLEFLLERLEASVQRSPLVLN